MLLHYYLVQFSFTKKRKYSTVSNTQTQHNSTVSTTVPVIFIPLAISQTQEHLLKNKIAYLPLLITILSPPIPLSPACLLPLTHLLPRLYPPSHSTTIAARCSHTHAPWRPASSPELRWPPLGLANDNGEPPPPSANPSRTINCPQKHKRKTDSLSGG